MRVTSMFGIYFNFFHSQTFYFAGCCCSLGEIRWLSVREWARRYEKYFSQLYQSDMYVSFHFTLRTKMNEMSFIRSCWFDNKIKENKSKLTLNWERKGMNGGNIEKNKKTSKNSISIKKLFKLKKKRKEQNRKLLQ